MNCSSCDVVLEFKKAVVIFPSTNFMNAFTADVSQHRDDCLLLPCRYCGIPKNSFCHTENCPYIPADTYHALWNLWSMESPEYSSRLQWLPNEMLEDVIVLTNKKRRTMLDCDFDGDNDVPFFTKKQLANIKGDDFKKLK